MLESLKRIQHDEKLSDGQMAAKLGVSRSSWSLYRRGLTALPDRVALTAAGVWPALTRELLHRAQSAADSLTNTTESASGQKDAA